MESPARRRLLGSVGAAGLLGLTGCSAVAAQRPELLEGAMDSVRPPFGRQVVEPSQGLDFVEPSQGLDFEERSVVGPLDNPNRSLIATAALPQIEVFAQPDESAEVTHVMDNPTATNGPLVFLTTVNAGIWHEVLLPVRPNGSTGWVRNSDVILAEHFYRIQVDLGDFRMRLFENGSTIFDAVAGVASNNTPTPGGTYYLTELLAPTVPDSVYGPFAYGLSGFSEVFETFNGGPGQLGIHGTNSPETLGSAVSAGCIRLHNEDISRLTNFLPLGVPVTVNA